MATRDLTPQLMKGEVWSVNGHRGAVTLPEPINSLDSDSTTAPLAAAQGKALKAIADGAVSTANEAKDGLDSKADKESNNFTTALQLKGDGVATEEYVKTADVSNTKIDGKAIKTYIADAIEAGGSIPNDATSVGSIAMVHCSGQRDAKSKPPAFKAIGTNGKFSNGYESGFTAKYAGLLAGGEVLTGEALSGTWVNLSAPAKLNSGSFETSYRYWTNINLLGIARRIA